MAKTPTDIRSLARAHTESAINVLAGIMNEGTAPHAARVSAAQALLDRGWGKAAQPLTDPDGGPLQIIVKKFSEEPSGGDVSLQQFARDQEHAAEQLKGKTFDVR